MSQLPAPDGLSEIAVALDECVAECDDVVCDTEVRSEPLSESGDDGDRSSPSSPCTPIKPARQASVPDGTRGAAGLLAGAPGLSEF